MPHLLEPKLYTIFKEGYTKRQFVRDLLAGSIVGVVALPLAIAFAIASGVKPEQGLYTAVVAGFVISVFGGSRAQISGPTGAFIVVIYGIVQQFGYEGLAVATFMAGLLLILMGILGFGALLKFVPYPLTVGFTSGIALIIFSSQMKDFFGLSIESMPADFIAKWHVIFLSFHTLNIWALCVATVSLGILVYLPRYSQRIPASLVVIVACTFLVYLLRLPVETIGSKFGSVPSSLPSPQLLHFDWTQLRELMRPAFTIALLGGIESLLSAVVADGMLGTRHRSNMELVAQGLGNIVSPLFQGIPATGAIARTATNIKNGGRTPVAGIVHAVVLLLIMRCFGNLAALIPMPALAAILVHVAYHMSEWRAFARALKYPKSDVAVLLVTFFLTVLVDLTFAIEVGVVLSAFLFVKRMETAAGIEKLSKEIQLGSEVAEPSRTFSRSLIPDGVEVFEIFGPIFFSAVERFSNALGNFEKMPKVLILYAPEVDAIDGSGLRALQSIRERAERAQCALLIAGASGQPLEALEHAEIVPASHLLPSLEAALVFATLQMAGKTPEDVRGSGSSPG